MTKKIAFSLMILLSIFFVSCQDEAAETEQVDMATEVARLWSCKETDDQGARNYEVKIEKKASDILLIKNFHNIGVDNSIEAKLTTDRILTVTEQTLPGTNLIVKECTGQISSDYQRITWNYKIDDARLGIYSVSATFTPGQISKSGAEL